MGTNLNTPVQNNSATLWLREFEPVPSGTGDTFLAISACCTGTPPVTVNTFKHGCQMIQLDTATSSPATYQNTGSVSSPVWTLFDTTVTGGQATTLVDTNSVIAVDVGTTASAVNNLRTTNAATTGAPDLSAVGSDTNIGITITPKGSGKVSVKGTGGKTVQQAWNYIASETGSNNAIAGALTDANGTAVPLAAGLEVIVQLAHTLQAGANTFVFNSVSKNIKSHFNISNNIGTAYAATGAIRLLYDGTQWVDMSQ